MQKNKTHELRNRLLFTVLILVIYMVGRSLLLFGIDEAAYHEIELDSQNIIESIVSGDRYSYSLFALGIIPSMLASLSVTLVLTLAGAEVQGRFSAKRRNRLTMVVHLVLAVLFAVSRADELIFASSSLSIGMLKMIAAFEMVIGSVIIYYMTETNGRHGIGNRTIIILVNILDNLNRAIENRTYQEMQIPLLICALTVLVMVVLELTLIRLPVQRVSIHNEYADKSYIAYKMNPIGVMPVMFAVTFFMLPQLVVKLLLKCFIENSELQRIKDRLVMTEPLGIGVYMAIIFLLTVVFSFVMLNPGSMADQLQHGGDSIVGVYAGKKTRRYIRRVLLALSSFSGGVQAGIMGFSLYISLKGYFPYSLALLPATTMILTGIIVTTVQEIRTYWIFDHYSFFI